MLKRVKNQKGFTLIELIVVIAILGILALIAVPRLAGFTGNANDKSIVADVKTIESAAVAYQSEHPDKDFTDTDFTIDKFGTYLDQNIMDKYDHTKNTNCSSITFDPSGRVKDFTIKVGSNTYHYTMSSRTVTH